MIMKFVEDNKSKTSINVEHEESIPIAVPGERLSATHLPAITEQIAKRRQQFSVKVIEYSFKIQFIQISESQLDQPRFDESRY